MENQDQTIHPWAVNEHGVIIRSGQVSLCPFQMKVLVPTGNAFKKGEVAIQDFPCSTRCPHCNLNLGQLGEYNQHEKDKLILQITCGGMPVEAYVEKLEGKVDKPKGGLVSV